MVLALVAIVGVGWYYSSVLHDDALAVDHSPDEFDLVVREVDGDRVVIMTTAATSGDNWKREGRDGLAWDGGWALLGSPIEVGEDRVSRQVLEGTPPPPGTPVRIDGWAYPEDPQVAHDIPFTTVDIAGELGSLPAWYIDGDSSTWVIAVHGKNAERREALRMLPVPHELGMPVLVISYRNDEGVAPDPSGVHRYGTTEWPDLAAAVEYALANGAQSVVLAGYSMGAGIVLSFMQHSSLAADADALVLDAPMISFSASVEFQAKDRGLWPILTSVGKKFAEWRYDVDWGATDYRSTARDLEIPVLLFHTTGDRTTPPSESVAWATHSPNVTLVSVEGEGHVRSWNLEPERYEQELREFLGRVIGSPAP